MIGKAASSTEVFRFALDDSPITSFMILPNEETFALSDL